MCLALTKEDKNEMRQEVTLATYKFILRVLNGKETRPGEVEALPEIIRSFSDFLGWEE